MNDETEQITNMSVQSPLDSGCRSPISLSPVLSKVYSRSMIKSLENILSMEIGKQKSSHKKSTKMRRSITLKDVSDFKFTRWSGCHISYKRIKEAKIKVTEAIQKGKVFTILGPYSKIRGLLRSRGWVEKFYLHNESINNSSNRKSRSSFKCNGDKSTTFEDGDDGDDDADDDDIDDDNDDVETTLGGLPPWEEEDGIYGLMSQMLKKIQPNLFWTLRKGQVDYKSLKKDQMINHHAKAGNFTTKTGLAKCLNQLRWYDDKEPDEFFPRCFIVSTMEEKNAFIDDFHFTACASLIKEAIADSANTCDKIEEVADSSNNGRTSDRITGKSNKKILPKINYCVRRRKKSTYINNKFLEMAMAYCEFILKIKSHEDIDKDDFIFCWNCDWDEFLNNYYKVVHNGFRIEGANNDETQTRCIEIAQNLKKKFPQFDMEGSRNVWILKPGAKSRGRGIMCYTRLNDVLKLLQHSFVANENRFIVQKYIERPLLIYNTKFDIRQWFMVTDWNPLTVWWYKDCYLRFCSQQYTLDDFNEAVHLSNNSIQHKYHNGPRSELLPPENMWDSNQFEEWLQIEGFEDSYRSIIQPGMKEAVIDVLLCVQDSVECRKNTFELYGADFMVSENDMKPWLIEINSSPCLSPSTPITARMTSAVLEDIFKVILDRKENKQCDIGRFEILYKQCAIIIPPYVGVDLKLSGTSIKNPTIPTMVVERRPITKPANDLFIGRHFKPRESRPFDQKSIDDATLTNSANSAMEFVSKFEEKFDGINKRYPTTIVLNSSQARLRSNSNKIPETNRDTVPSIFKTSLISPAEEFKGRKTSSNAIIELNNLPEYIGKYRKPKKESNISVSLDLSSDNTIVPQYTTKQNSDSDYLSCLSNTSKLPIVIKMKPCQKPEITKLDRQYKLPSKVEVVNITVAKPIANAIRDENLKKKQTTTKLFKRPSNSQMLTQRKQASITKESCATRVKRSKIMRIIVGPVIKSAILCGRKNCPLRRYRESSLLSVVDEPKKYDEYVLSKQITSCHNHSRLSNKSVHLKRTLSIISEIGMKGHDCCKTDTSTKLRQRSPTFQSRRGDNNNHIALIDFTTPIVY